MGNRLDYFLDQELISYRYSLMFLLLFLLERPI